MFVDPNQVNPHDKILGGPKMNDDFNGIKSTWALLRPIIRKQKIEIIYGTKNTDRKENF